MTSSNKTDPVCANCKHWWISESDLIKWNGSQPFGLTPRGEGYYSHPNDYSACRARSPVREGNSHADMYGSAKWPTTRWDDTCGEWVQRPDKTESGPA